MKHFNTFDEVIEHYALRFNNLESIKRTKAREEYKKEMLELNQEFHSLPMTQIKTKNKHFKQQSLWVVGELLSEIFAMNPPLMYRYKPSLIEWAYKLRPDKSAEYSYGRRWNEWNQILNVVETLSNRRDSKKAVIAIYTPYDTYPSRNDCPCTLGYDFKVRNGKIDMTTFFRSHDFFRGMKYDNFISSFVAQSIAMMVNSETGDNIEPGTLYNYDGSLHVYKQDYDKLQPLIEGREVTTTSFNIMYPYKTIQEYYDDLDLIVKSQECSYFSNFEKSISYHDRIQNPVFKDFAKMYFNRNSKHAGLEDRMEYETEVLK